MVKMRWNGPGRCVTADEDRNASINVQPGEEIEVSEKCAAQLAGIEGWELSDKPKGKVKSKPGEDE